MSEWRDMTLGDFVALQRGHDLTEPQRRIGRVPVMGSAGQNGFHDTAIAKGPGIVIGRSGASFGQVHFSKEDFWPHNTGLYVTDFKGNDPLFAFYFLKALDFDRFNSGSAQPSLNRNFIYPIPIRVPKPAEQKAIAAVLGALDDKIELNRRMNATLEAMARALFQSWFIDFDPVRANLDRNQPSPAASRHPLPVGEGRGEGAAGMDFDPVRAKLDGRKPVGLDKVTAALFPEHLEETALGHIPKGWNAGTVVEGFNLTMGQSPPGDTYNAEGNGLPFYQGRTDFARFEAEGTVFGSINKDSFEKLRFNIPPDDIVAAYERQAGPLDEQIRILENQSRTLATLRDTLLPRLLSGEFAVGKFKKEVFDHV